MMTSFQAKQFQNGSKNSSSVLLKPLEQGLLVKTSDGEQTLSYADLELKPVGYLDNLAILYDRQSECTLISEDRKLLRELAAMASGKLQEQINTQQLQRKRDIFRICTTWSALVLCIVAVLVAIPCNYDRIVDQAMHFVPTSVDAAQGTAALNEYRQSNALESDSVDALRVKRIARRLLTHLGPNPYHFAFFVHPSHNPNAFALPGGKVVVESELLRCASNDDEIACVLAHEFGHVMMRHSIRSALYETGTSKCLEIIFNPHGNISYIFDKCINLNNLRHTRQQETDADVFSVNLASTAGYDPHRFITILRKLPQNPYDGAGLFGILTDHPVTDARIARIEEEIRKRAHP